jgi:hypothetical protein
MQYASAKRPPAVFLAVALHVLVFALASNDPFKIPRNADRTKADETIVVLMVVPAPGTTLPEPDRKTIVSPPVVVPSTRAHRDNPPATRITPRQPASMAAPAAPTAEEWAFAARYTLKNSKGYRYHWGQHVRSLMGAAVEGPDQGVVRFRVEIAPDGTLARLETLWTTSIVAERLARKAIESLPPLPPTPTGRPLIFDRTISFTPDAADAPPIYRDDCLPDPPAFTNPFAWDGKSPQVRAEPRQVEAPDPLTLEDCLKQLPQDSIEAENAHDQRVIDRWGARQIGR